jgi:hypothetical protein
VHLTLCAEWPARKWGGILPPEQIPDLLDKDGFLYGNIPDYLAHVKPMEAAAEARAQIKKALDAGIPVTHIDSHMATMLLTPELITVYQQLGKEFELPVTLPMNLLKLVVPQVLPYVNAGDHVPLNQMIVARPGTPVAGLQAFYDQALDTLSPGLNELIFHPAFDDEEMNALCGDRQDYGRAWRQYDYDYATSAAFAEKLAANNIQLTSWKEIGENI